MANTNAKKISQYTACTSVKSTDYVVVNSYDSTSNTYITKKATANALFSNVSSLVISSSLTPANSYAANDIPLHQIWISGDYIYAKTGNTEIRRAALSLF